MEEAEAIGRIELADALDQLKRLRPRLAQVVYLRFYAGMNDAEIGELLAIEEKHRASRLAQGARLAACAVASGQCTDMSAMS